MKLKRLVVSKKLSVYATLNKAVSAVSISSRQLETTFVKIMEYSTPRHSVNFTGNKLPPALARSRYPKQKQVSLATAEVWISDHCT